MPIDATRLTLVFGGARSGKSAASERMAAALASETAGTVTYIATAEARDEEMISRAALHRARRPSAWHTIEEPFAVDEALRRAEGSVCLIDCLTLYISNWLLRLESEGLRGKELENAVLSRVDALIVAAKSGDKHVVVVSNEVGQGVVPAYPLGRIFRDIAGKANQRLAQAADDVIYCLAGLQLRLKKAGQTSQGADDAMRQPAESAPSKQLPHIPVEDAPPACFYEGPGLALQFLTRLPGPIMYLAPESRLVDAMRWFPAVGGFIGLLASLTGALALQVLTPEVTAALVIAVIVMMTGNLHFDGLMDTADGVYGGYTTARRLEIMQDSRMGAHGVAAGILVTLVKWSALTMLLENGAALWMLPLTLAASRWSLVLAARTQPAARPEGFAAIYAKHLHTRHVLGATAIWGCVALVVLSAAGINGSILSASRASLFAVALMAVLALIIAMTVAWLLGRYFKAKLGGMTGDTLGATNELVEVAILLVAAALL